jgi:hypothetical protein
MRVRYPHNAQAVAESRRQAYAARLDRIARDGDDTAALRAIEALNNRVLGRPKETVETQTRGPHPDLEKIRNMSQEERDELYWQLMDEEDERKRLLAEQRSADAT